MRETFELSRVIEARREYGAPWLGRGVDAAEGLTTREEGRCASSCAAPAPSAA